MTSPSPAASPAAALNTAATPREVLAAVFPAASRVANLELAPLSLGHFLLLEHLESPFVEEGGAAALTALDIAIAVYVLAHPVRAVHAQVTNDRAVFIELVHGFAATIPARELPALGARITDSIKGGFDTVIGADSEKKATAATTA